MDGYSTAAELRKRGIKIPIIAMTAKAMNDDEDSCRQAGCTGYISKPFDQDHLFNTVFSALSNAEKKIVY